MYHSIHFNSTLKICVTSFISTGNLSTVLHREKFFRQKGSLYHLRNLINRRNVTGPEDVTSNFRYMYIVSLNN